MIIGDQREQKSNDDQNLADFLHGLSLLECGFIDSQIHSSDAKKVSNFYAMK